MSGQREFVLPHGIVGPTDVSRLLREVEALEDYFHQSTIRAGGEQQPAPPRMSRLMDSLVTDNQLNILQTDHRQFVQTSLERLHMSAPVVHISFSVDPPGSYTQKIVAWMRANIHPTVLVTVGLQPNIGAGCVLRTTNQIFDLSLREFFHSKREFFISRMHQAVSDTSEFDVSPAEDQSDAPVPVADGEVAVPGGRT